MATFPDNGSKSVSQSRITDNNEPTRAVLSNDAIVICHWIIFTALCQPICLLGFVTNIINIICFIKQGFKDPVNVSFLALAFADIGCLLTMTVTNICFTPAVNSADLPFDPIEFSYLAGGMSHGTFTRITGWFTALITLERCMCIAAPLKVKTIVTSKRMTIVFACVFFILIASISPVYVVNRMDLKFFPHKNKTLLGLFYTEEKEEVETLSYAINNIFLPFTSFVIIIVCTAVLSIILKKKSKWLNKSANSAQSDNVSIRNQKVATMVVMISSLFIACYVPIIITCLGMCIVPGFTLYGKYRDILFIVGGIGFTLETINSSMNIFIYYHMSTNFRRSFSQLFCLQKTD